MSKVSASNDIDADDFKNFGFQVKMLANDFRLMQEQFSSQRLN